MENDRERKELEIAHQARVAADKSVHEATPNYIIERFRTAKLWRLFPKEFMFKCLKEYEGKKVVDFGCGDGEISTQLASVGAYTTGLDISPDLIELARKRAELDGVKDRCEFIVTDIEESPLPSNAYDHVVCSAVIHHVDIAKTVPLLYDCLKPGGSAIIAEPIAFSPLLQKIRDAFPIKKVASPVEHQLTKKDIKLVCSFFDGHETTYFELFGRFQRFFPNRNKIDKGHPFTKAALVTIHSIDRWLVTLFPFLSRYYSIAVIVARKAEK